MLHATWRRLGSSALLALGLLALPPAMAQAQLFPNRTIRRERPPCASEPPFNAQVRRDYFGYYPTCWSRFPAGWACPCPNPELPNMANSIKEYGPIDPKRRNGASDLDRAPGMEGDNPDDPQPANPAGDNPAVPLPNNGRSPFDLDPSPTPNLKPGGGGGGGGAPAPAPTAPNAGRPSGSSSLMEMPKLPETSPTTSYDTPLKPGSIALAPEATLASTDSSELRPDLGPLPSAPSTAPAAGSTTQPAPVGMPMVGQAAPAQAPRRKGILGGLFGNRNR